MNIRYIVELGEEERTRLHELTSGGQARVRRVKRGQILLAAEQGHGDAAVAAMVGVETSTAYRTKRRFVEGGVEVALSEGPRVGAKRKLTGREETLLVAVAGSDPPAGRARWTLERRDIQPSTTTCARRPIRPTASSRCSRRCSTWPISIAPFRLISILYSYFNQLYKLLNQPCILSVPYRYHCVSNLWVRVPVIHR